MERGAVVEKAAKKEAAREKAAEKRLAATITASEAWDNTRAAKEAIGRATRACLVAKARREEARERLQKARAKALTSAQTDWAEVLADVLVGQ